MPQVVQNPSVTDGAMAERLLNLFRKKPSPRCRPYRLLVLIALFSSCELKTSRGVSPSVSVSAMEVSQSLGCSVVLAKQHLFTAETAGVLCRDQSADGVRFHINFFCETSRKRAINH